MLITSDEDGFVDVFKLLISDNIRVDDGINFDENKEENFSEIAIKYRRIQTTHVLLEY